MNKLLNNIGCITKDIPEKAYKFHNTCDLTSVVFFQQSQNFIY